jgi:GntR family transcriptional regulator/MocR family aminotransferase
VRVRAAYVTPSHQYPLGTSMTAGRRFALLDWALRQRAWVLEDDYDSEYRYVSRPLGALQGMDAHERVIYIGTFSKVLFPAVRVGYLVVPPSLRQRFSDARESVRSLLSHPCTSSHSRSSCARDTSRGICAACRAVYLNRRDALLSGLARHCGDRLYRA